MTAKPRARKFRVRRAEPLTRAFAGRAALSVVGGTGTEALDMGPPAPAAGSAARPGAKGAARAAAAPSAPTDARPAAAAPVAPVPLPTRAAPAARLPAAEPVMEPEPDAAFDALEEAPAAPLPALSPGESEVEAIRAEGLTGRQLRMARRVAQRHGIAVTSDFEAVRELRARGIDPFQQTNLLALVQGDAASGEEEAADEEGRIQLPQTRPGALVPARPLRSLPGAPAAPAPAADPDAVSRRAAEIARIQADIARRRRRRLAGLLARLAVFVILPTVLAGWYFARVATPMFATRSEFVIQKAEATGGMAGLGGLFSGTSMATQQDSMTVQAYLASRAAMQRLDADHAFRAAFSAPGIDVIQRLAPDATEEEAYRLYQDHVKIAYDPTEGIVKMEVIAPDPEVSESFSRALISYAEEQVDQLTARLREDQMAEATSSYQAAEARRAEALQAWLDIQAEVQQIDPVGETAARTSQISALESQRQQLQLELQTRLSVPRPNEAQVNALRSQIANIEGLIEQMRTEMTQETIQGSSLASKNTELRLAEENYTFQTLLVQQALTQMETAQVEANRQVRYLSLGVEPVAPDEATYPRAVENTALAFLIFAGFYLMASLTASILREQVTG